MALWGAPVHLLTLCPWHTSFFGRGFFQSSHGSLPKTNNDLLASANASKPVLHLMSIQKGFP